MTIKSQTFEEPLALEMGGVLENPTVAYTTYGTLNQDKDNTILVCHALTANSEVHDWWSGLFGAGRVIDPNDNFVICINNLGSPYGSSSPKSLNTSGERFGLNFPSYTIRDTAALHIKLLRHMGIARLKLLMGGSCGGNIAQEISLTLGDQLEEMIILCCSASETPWVISIHESQRIVLRMDPTFVRNDGLAAQAGLKGARAFALPFYRSHPSFKIRQSEEDNNKLDDFKASSYVRYQGEKFVKRYDAHCYYKQLNSLDTHNISRGRSSLQGALSLVKARTLCIGFSTDVLIPVVEQKILAEHIPNATYAEIETQFGHDAFLIETNLIQTTINNWRNNNVRNR